MRKFNALTVILIASALTRDADCQTSENRLLDSVVPKFYDLSIRVDIDERVFNGTVAIDVHVNRNVSIVQMHNIGLTITEKVIVKSMTNDNIASESNNILYDNATEIMNIELDRMLSAESDYRLILSFSGLIHSDMKGLYMSTYYDGGVKYIATTFSAAAYARKIFPCFDEPNFKATFRLKVACPKDLFALANTKAINVEHSDDWRITEFDETIPMSTYLLAFTVCDFKNITSIDGLDFSVYASSKEYKNMQFALDIGTSALKALESYTGHSYPRNKMDFIAIDDFLLGAMENWGLISYKTSRIVNPTGKRNRKKMQDIITIITHELVHQWFGNMVTCEYWDFVWLNEGFASYVEYIIADKILPDWRILEQFTIQDMHPVMLNDVKPKTHAMTRPVNTPEEITKIYDFVAYPKAASVIRMIEHVMSPSLFKMAIYRYLDERKYSTATEEQLFDVLERTRRLFNAVPNLPSIADIFRSWSQTPSYPILNVKFKRGEGTVAVSQELFLPNLNETEESSFMIPFNFVTSDKSSWNTDVAKWNCLVDKNEMNLTVSKNVDWVVFNIHQTGYYRVNYDIDNWNAIINVLDSSTFHTIHILNRAQLLDDSFSLAKSGYLNFTESLNMLKYLHREYELAPITAGFNAIDFMLTHFDDQPFYEHLRGIMLNIIDEIYERVNYPSHPEYPKDFSENHRAVVKLKVNLMACRIGAPLCVKDANEKMRFDKIPDVDDRPHFYCGILRGVSAEIQWNNLWHRLQEVTASTELSRDNQEEINEILYAFTRCDNDIGRVEKLLLKLLNETGTGERKAFADEATVIVIGDLIRTSNKHRDFVMDFYEQHYEAVNDTAPLSAVLKVFAEAINTDVHSVRLKHLGAKHAVDVNEYLLDIERNIFWMKMKVPEIAAWVENEKGAAIKLNFSIMVIIFSITVMAFQ